MSCALVTGVQTCALRSSLSFRLNVVRAFRGKRHCSFYQCVGQHQLRTVNIIEGDRKIAQLTVGKGNDIALHALQRNSELLASVLRLNEADPRLLSRPVANGRASCRGRVWQACEIPGVS